MLDATDLKILECLLNDARRAHKEIGERVHLTGQAVGSRIRKMEDAGIIEGVTVTLNYEKLGHHLMAHITVTINAAGSDAQFQTFLQEHPDVREAYRISGEGCYMLRLLATSDTELNDFLEQLQQYAHYEVHLCLNRIK
ncbi:Lrp/AsnC family transcriptional regulator [Paenibacillus sp. H1-7]|uniref:Lrp/AsnC family transcriptional regulator n=1 Tax=Paenibacillus sp. H1-7 TaxID=2282849 RepID=UPI001EF90AA8|nr:Lrp/AsnC family transcriptional regulator [Paenibacillus sp. H1-7]